MIKDQPSSQGLPLKTNSPDSLFGVVDDLSARLAALEKQGKGRAPTPHPDTTAPPVRINYLSKLVVLKEGTVSGPTDWMDSGVSKWVPGKARHVLLWVGIKDSTDGIGSSIIEAYSGTVVMPIAEIFEPTAPTPQSSFGYCLVPVVGGNFSYRVTPAAGASALAYKIGVMGWGE